jgi:hypothetical protein
MHCQWAELTSPWTCARSKACSFGRTPRPPDLAAASFMRGPGTQAQWMCALSRHLTKYSRSLRAVAPLGACRKAGAVMKQPHS